MAILTQSDLEKRICSDKASLTNDKIYISPYDSANCLTSMGYDLRVGEDYRRYASNKDVYDKLKQGERIILDPGDTALIVTREKVDLPKDGSLSAIIVSKVSIVAMGFSGISTKVDPGWYGHLKITVHNLSKTKLSLGFEQPFCTIVFIKNNTNEVKYQYKERTINPMGLPTRERRRIPWGFLLPLSLVLIIPAIAYVLWGEGTKLTLSVPVAVCIAQLVERLWTKK